MPTYPPTYLGRHAEKFWFTSDCGRHHRQPQVGARGNQLIPTKIKKRQPRTSIMARTEEAQAFFFAVYSAVQQIPHGRVTSYGHIAKLVGFRKFTIMAVYRLQNTGSEHILRMKWTLRLPEVPLNNGLSPVPRCLSCPQHAPGAHGLGSIPSPSTRHGCADCGSDHLTIMSS